MAAAVLRLLFHPDFDLLARCQRGKVAAQAEAKLPLLLALTCLHGFHQQAELVRWQLVSTCRKACIPGALRTDARLGAAASACLACT